MPFYDVTTGFQISYVPDPYKDKLFMCGDGASGQLGNNARAAYSSPVQIGSLTNWKDVSMGKYHTLGIETDGTLWSWGVNDNGQLGLNVATGLSYSSPVQIGSLTNWTSISAGHLCSFAIKNDGTLWAWGRNADGQLGNNTRISYSSPIQIGSLNNWKQVACGYAHTAAVRSDGTLWTWGNNSDNFLAAAGQLGNNTTLKYSSPVQVGSLTNWSSVQCAKSSTLALKTDGTLWAWGDGRFSSLGNSTIGINYSSPVQIGSLTNWKQLSKLNLAWHVFATQNDGSLWAWGWNGYGQLGNNSSAGGYESSPIQIGSLTEWNNIKDIAAAGSHSSYAVRNDGSLWAWGNNSGGVLGINRATTLLYSSPVQVGSLTFWNKVSCGYTSAFILDQTYVQDLGERYVTKDYLLDTYPNIASTLGARTSPGLWAWGENTSGTLGNNRIINYSSPVQIGSLTDWKQVAAASHAAYIKTDSSLWACGYNVFGALGNNASSNYSSPVQIGSLTNWKQVACGYSATASIKTNGTLWAWGRNEFGQTGNGFQSAGMYYSSPVQIGALTTWKQVACSGLTLSAVKTDGTLWACGYNRWGTLGNNTTAYYSSPVQIGALTNWKQVSYGPGSLHTAAVKTDGTLWAWGYNLFGQLGNNTRINYSSPVQIGSLTNWKQVAAGFGHTLAIKTDGTLWACGYNRYGELGNNTSLYYSSPIQVGSLTNWKQISGGNHHTLAIKSDGSLWVWGYSLSGELGLNNKIAYSSPIQIGSSTNWKQIAAGAYVSIAIQDGYI